MCAKAWAIALMETRQPQKPKVTAAFLCPTIRLIKKSCPCLPHPYITVLWKLWNDFMVWLLSSLPWNCRGMYMGRGSPLVIPQGDRPV